jgi:hypothetical protein
VPDAWGKGLYGVRELCSRFRIAVASRRASAPPVSTENARAACLRAAIKRRINERLGSEIIEEKSYPMADSFPAPS